MSMARCRLKLTSCCAFLLIGLVVNCRCHLNNNTKPANVREFDSCQYAVPVWHHLINRTQAQQLESIQKRAVHIIYNITCGMSYPNVLFVAELESLETRRTNLSRSFFFRTFANQPLVFTISFYLHEMPLWSLDWDLPLPFLNPVYEPKSTVHLLTLAFTITKK